jgi:PKD repeat protein
LPARWAVQGHRPLLPVGNPGSGFRSFSQCVAISIDDDPNGGYNRYEFSFDNVGFNDYPKHGIVSDSITLMANIFRARGPFFNYAGTFLGVMDKAAMYAGNSALLIGFNIGTGQFGFVAGDLDGHGNVGALFATAMSSANQFDIWEIDVDWSTEDASALRIAAIPVSPYDSSLCGVSRGACIPQPNNGPALESLSDRLMHRLQIRDFGSYRTMLAAQTVDAGGNNGPSGIHWYEFRESNGTWSKRQEGTYAPNEGLYRWMPSIAMNKDGDIGVGFLFGNDSTPMSIAVTGQTAAEGLNASGLFDAGEAICVVGTGVHEDAGRSGDYASTSIDPLDGKTFWHTNEYVQTTAQFSWNTYVCPFTIGGGDTGGNIPPEASFTATVRGDNDNGRTIDFNDSGSSDSDNGPEPLTYDWNFGDRTPPAEGEAPSHTYTTDGDFNVTLTVSDGAATDSASVTVTADDGFNEPPTVTIDSAGCTGLFCSFTATGSDIDGSIVSYDWTFGDDPTPGTASGASVSYEFSASGTYTVSVTVTDDGRGDGAKTNSTSTSVTATEPLDPVTASIGSIVVDTVNTNRRNKAGRAVVTIVDDQGNPVSGATVTGNFLAPYDEPASGATVGDGTVTFQTNSTLRGGVSFEFCVDSVEAPLPLLWDGNTSCASF